MALTTKAFSDEAALRAHLRTHEPTFFISSQTSTVIPYDKIAQEITTPLVIGDLSKLKGEMRMNGTNLILRGAVNWQEADQFLKAQGRAIMTSPTEQLALVLAGVATSCTGERCFAYGNLRRQIERIKYFDFDGNERELIRDKVFPQSDSIVAYQERYARYAAYKNAPFPRFQQETDLMIGTEGQLGVISEVELKTTANDPVTHLFILLPRWEDDFEPHLEIYYRVQSFRQDVISCELLDSNCMNYLKPEERLGTGQDVIFLEIKSEAFEHVYGELIGNLTLVSPENIFEITSQKFHQVRAGVPRAVFEENSRMGVKKMGTDCQVRTLHFPDLLNFYRESAKLGVRYNLFGHFGDAHLHYNYMPAPAQTAQCQQQFEKLYAKVLEWEGSPFAEHGIGLLKQKFIRDFLGEEHFRVFRELKHMHDPYGQFFPQGFMTTLQK
ncbi:MAG: FAD-binding oxidoreductase [Bacteriovoracia bacterium]